MASDKFPERERTFETRVLFIRELFTSRYEPYKIMANCVRHKLDRSYDAYLKEIHRSVLALDNKDPLAVLKRIDG